jgi:acetyltransferase-like isoleucine patch superfamily enzyme
MTPYRVKSGKLHAGVDCTFGDGVVVDVAEDVVIGDRCVIPDNAYLSGRSIKIGDDFYGYSWDWRRLDVGRGRRDEEDAVLTVGNRCTFHDNRIDLARRVTIGDDVGLSPEVAIYTHGYWQSELEGFPTKFAPVQIDRGTVIGFRSVILPGVRIEHHAVIGAQSLVTGNLYCNGIYGGNPAKRIGLMTKPEGQNSRRSLCLILDAYRQSCLYRGLEIRGPSISWPLVGLNGTWFDAVNCKVVEGPEDEFTDDLREFLFKRGIRIYTRRPFRKLPRRNP